VSYNLLRVRRFDRTCLRPDAFAGLGVAAYLVPQVMAYATLAGLDPVVGLWASLLPLTIYALVGTSRLLSVGPESTTAIMTAAALAPLAAGDAATYAAMAAFAALIVGAMCLLGGILHLGIVASLLSKPVLIGYLAGVAVIMIAGQLGKLFGITVASGTPVAQIWSALGELDGTNLASAAVGMSVIVVLFLGTSRWPRVPWPLIAVLAATLATTVLDLEQYGVTVVGDVPDGLPGLSIPTDLTPFLALIGPAAGIAVVAFTDNVLTARAFAAPGEEIDSDAELRALGIANIGAGLTSGFPVSSSGSRTALAKVSVARTPAYGMVTTLAVVCVLVFAGPLLENFPMAALGGLVVFAAFKIVEFAEFRWLWNFRRSEFWLGVAAFVAVLTLDLLVGIGFAVALSVMAMLARVARPHAAVLGQVPGLAGMHDVGEYPTAQEVEGLIVFRYDSPLFFANAEDFRTRVLEAVDDDQAQGRAVRRVLLNCEAMVDADSTAVGAMQELVRELQRRDIEVSLARVHVELAELLERAGILGLVGADNVYPTLPTAVAGYREDENGTQPPAT
ncbi:MAG TPA: sulfate permease, partial [Candidatus Limnocylindrales bacterium]|nr:sulfate permease [Candidatus Limnocylindrales bacterium]